MKKSHFSLPALRFPPLFPRRFYQRPDKVEPAPSGLGRVEWVLARPLYRFKNIEVSQIPPAKRRQILELQLQQWSPYANPAYCVAWQQDRVLVWCWDADRVQQALAEAKLGSRRVRIIPESLLYPLQQSGLRLIGNLEGVEGQLWENNGLLHSRWWPAAPDAAEWLAFQRDAGIPPERQDAAQPKAQRLALQASPWIPVAGLKGYEASGVRNERLFYAAAALLLALPTLWYGMHLYKLGEASASRAAELAALKNQARPVLEARSQALQALARVESLSRLDPYPDPLTLMAKVAETIPTDGSYLKEWSYQDGRLRITITSPVNTISSSFLVNALQLAGPFGNVRALPGNDPKTVSITMDLVKDSRAADHV